MKKALLSWDIYEIRTKVTEIHGVMLRGRLRTLGLERNCNILCENASDAENCVRFAVPSGENIVGIDAYLHSIIADAQIDLVRRSIINPVLSKLKVRKSATRYS